MKPIKKLQVHKGLMLHNMPIINTLNFHRLQNESLIVKVLD
jgi:hypothetical protein